MDTRHTRSGLSRSRAGILHRRRNKEGPSTSSRRTEGDDLALYVHWPFCVSKCPYCDFNSHVRESVDQAAWREALLADLAWEAAALPGPPARLDLLRRRHALADAAGDGGGADRGGRAALGLRARTSRSRSRPIPPRSRRPASPISPRRASTGSRSACSRSTTRRCASSAAPMTSAEGLAALATAQGCFGRVSFDLIYALPGQSEDGLGGGARPGARLRHRPPLALPADHRARHALRRDGRARRAAGARSGRGGGALRADAGDDRGRRPARLRNLQPCPARRGEPPQPRLLALPALSRHRPGRARPARRRSPPSATASRRTGSPRSPATATASPRRRRSAAASRRTEALLMGLRLSEGVELEPVGRRSTWRRSPG